MVVLQLLDMMLMMERTFLISQDQGLMISSMLQGPAMWVTLEHGFLVPHYNSKVCRVNYQYLTTICNDFL